MGRDTWRFRAQERERAKKKRGNPLWRGVGCMVIVVFTIAAYFFADWFLGANAVEGWVYIPPEIISPTFAPSLPPGLLMKGAVALLFMMLSYGLVSTIYAIAFPIRPGETDYPPIKRSGPPRKR